MDDDKLRIAHFDITSMVSDPAIVMIAKRGSGKSWVIRDIVSQYKHIPVGVIIAPTDEMNGFYKSFFPDLFIHHDVDPKLLANILKRQNVMTCNYIRMQEELKQGKKVKAVDPSLILIMDDCLADAKDWKKDPTVTAILLNGRHYHFTFVLTMQDPIGVPPMLRMNFDYYFILGEDSQINVEKIYKNFASIFPNLYTFKKTFAELTADFGVMVINNRLKDTDITKKVYYYKAVERKFMFGSKQFIGFHSKYYDKNYKMRQLLDDKGLDLSKFNSKNGGLVIEKV